MAPDDTTTPPAGEQGPVPAAPPAEPTSAGLDKDTRYWAMGCHLASFALYLVPYFPLLGLIAPLTIWFLKREGSPFIDLHGKAVVNFQISLLIYGMVAVLLAFILIGIPLLIALIILHIVSAINGAVHAQNGEPYQYPLTIQFIK